MYNKDWVDKGEYTHTLLKEEKKKNTTKCLGGKGIDYRIINRVPSKSMISGLKQPWRCRYFIFKRDFFLLFQHNCGYTDTKVQNVLY